MPSVRITALPLLFDRYTDALEPSLKSSDTFWASAAARTWSAAETEDVFWSSQGCQATPTATEAATAAAATSEATRNRRRRIGTTLLGADSSVRGWAISGGSGRMVEIPASTEVRRESGGVMAASSAIRAAASRRLETSAWQSRQ